MEAGEDVFGELNAHNEEQEKSSFSLSMIRNESTIASHPIMDDKWLDDQDHYAAIILVFLRRNESIDIYSKASQRTLPRYKNQRSCSYLSLSA
eukprot:scaffold203041_cov38-Attheya_sp.AAC.1